MTYSILAEGLVKRGLLRVIADKADRRISHVVLTAAGTKLAERIAPLAATLRKAGTQNMSERELSALRASLRKFTENLDSFAGSST